MLERTVITTTGARLASALCRTSRGRSSAGVGAARWHWIARRRDRASEKRDDACGVRLKITTYVEMTIQ